MLAEALKYLSDEVNHYYDNPVTPALEEFVTLGNIARLDNQTDASNAGLGTKVVLSLVNIEEEKTLKNSPFQRVTADKTVENFNPPIFINLYLLFSCADDKYDMALTKLSRVIGFFQSKYVFTPATAEVPFPGGVEKIILDLFSLNFEQINHLWGIMGGKYIPSVLYKARLLMIQQSDMKSGPVVKEIETLEKSLPRPLVPNDPALAPIV